MKKGDLLAGLGLIGLGIFITHRALQLDYVNEYGPGPGFLPLWLGIGFLILAAPLVVMTLLRSASPEQGAWGKVGRALAAWFGLIAATGLLNRLGFILSFTILTLFLVFVLDRRPLLAALAVAVGSAFGFYLIFSVALRVSLPVGPWGF